MSYDQRNVIQNLWYGEVFGRKDIQFCNCKILWSLKAISDAPVYFLKLYNKSNIQLHSLDTYQVLKCGT